jgi:L-ascorbate metabolism protein UlaG (beta-lactamase superfamily)
VHFRQIGYHYGPFDLTIIENGQYSIYWPDSHIMPEDAVKAHIELRGKKMLPVHWGSFKLSIHDWWEPIERASSEALRQGVNLLTPRVGQILQIDDNPTTSAWWQDFLPQK